ncbi:MAG: hypothetical protein ACYCUC_15605 [Candidatus Dormibacteria bacterium]
MVKLGENEYEVTEDEILAELESESQRRFGRPWAEVYQTWDLGELDPAEIADLLIVADLLPDKIPA